MWIDARRILPLHEIRRNHHFHELVARMRKSGWQGRPLVAEALADGQTFRPHRGGEAVVRIVGPVLRTVRRNPVRRVIRAEPRRHDAL